MARPMHEVGRHEPERHDAVRHGPGWRRPPRSRDNRRRWGASAVAALIVVGLVMVTLFGLPPSTARPGPTAGASTNPDNTSGAAATARAAASGSPAIAASTPPPTQPPTMAPTLRPPPTSRPSSSPVATRHPDAAPANAAEFDLQAQVIVIGFPLKERARYRYRDNFGDPREGHAEDYNHARSRRGDELLRAHDGIDIYAATGTPIVAPFDGIVIDPAGRWRPWIPERYGKTAVILSSEPESAGYTAVLAHLDALYVEPGQRVHRGEVVGTTGDSGNAEGGRPHLHFELRAPFPLNWDQVGEERLVDAFNPYHSLRAADPKRSD